MRNDIFFDDDDVDEVIESTDIIDATYEDLGVVRTASGASSYPDRLDFGNALKELEAEMYHTELTSTAMEGAAKISMMEERLSKVFASSPHYSARFRSIADRHVQKILSRMERW